ncbi:MAG: hypothetical protein M3440_04565 [Chloroflexota bacterium]|nr:hypothetical protein [Chloroflexota bacterium]
MSDFKWTAQKTRAAIALADGKTHRVVAGEVDISTKTVSRWLQEPEFAVEVDRLTLMMGIASRAERLRIAKRIVRSRVGEDIDIIISDKDVLDWLKYAQSETDGIRLDMVAVAEAVQGSRS